MSLNDERSVEIAGSSQSAGPSKQNKSVRFATEKPKKRANSNEDELRRLRKKLRARLEIEYETEKEPRLRETVRAQNTN